jgi:hypothetical protein
MTVWIYVDSRYRVGHPIISKRSPIPRLRSVGFIGRVKGTVVLKAVKLPPTALPEKDRCGGLTS